MKLRKTEVHFILLHLALVALRDRLNGRLPHGDHCCYNLIIARHIFEPLFSDGSYGYRPKRSAQQAIQRVKEYAEQVYTHAVEVDLSKYFDTLNHELLMNLLRKQIHDKRVLKLIKRHLKSGVMENGVVCKTEEGSPQGGPLSPLPAKIYLNEYDQEMERRGVKAIRYADDIVVLDRSKRTAQHLLEGKPNAAGRQAEAHNERTKE